MNNSLGNDLLLTSARLNRWASRHAKLPAPAGQLRLLSLVDHMGPSRIGDLATADNSSQPTMTTQVQRLEVLGLVERRHDARDARATVVAMTPKGQDILEQARQARAAVVAPLLADLSAEEVDLIDRATQALDRALRAQHTEKGADTV